MPKNFTHQDIIVDQEFQRVWDQLDGGGGNNLSTNEEIIGQAFDRILYRKSWRFVVPNGTTLIPTGIVGPYLPVKINYLFTNGIAYWNYPNPITGQTLTYYLDVANNRFRADKSGASPPFLFEVTMEYIK